MTLFHMNKVHTVRMIIYFWLSKFGFEFNRRTLIHIKQGHKKKGVAHTSPTNLDSVGAVTVRTVSIMLP